MSHMEPVGVGEGGGGGGVRPPPGRDIPVFYSPPWVHPWCPFYRPAMAPLVSSYGMCSSVCLSPSKGRTIRYTGGGLWVFFLSKLFFSFPRPNNTFFPLVDPNKTPPPFPSGMKHSIGLLNFLYFFFMCGENSFFFALLLLNKPLKKPYPPGVSNVTIVTYPPC